MLTTKDFKAAHSLSDSSFQRLSQRVAMGLPDGAKMTHQVSSTQFEILFPDEFEAAVTTRKPRAAKKAIAPKTSELAITPTEVLPANQVNGFGSMEVFKPSQPVNYQQALAEFQLPTLTPLEVSTASDIQAMQQEMYTAAITAMSNQRAVFEALKRKAVEEGTREGQELARLKFLSTQNALQNGASFLAQSQGLETLES